MKAQGALGARNTLLDNILQQGGGNGESYAMRSLQGRKVANATRASEEGHAHTDAMQRQAKESKADVEKRIAQAQEKKAEQARLEEKQAQQKAEEAAAAKRTEDADKADSGAPAPAQQGDVVRISATGAQAAQQVTVAALPQSAAPDTPKDAAAPADAVQRPQLDATV